MIITIARQELKAALLFASTDETRYVINGVNIEARAGKAAPVLVATDGRRLAVIETQAQQAADFTKDCTILIRPDFVKALCALSKALGGKNCPWLAFDVTHKQSVEITIIGKDVSLVVNEEAFMDEKYPDWRQVVPAKSKKREPITDIGLNAEYVGDFARASKLLGGESPIMQMNLVGKEQQVEVKLQGLPQFYGLVMQCKLNTDIEYQPEFLAIAEAFPKPVPEQSSSEESE
jgi:hypothetical protein